MKGKFSLTNQLEMFEDVPGWIDKDEPMDMVYLDFHKAFEVPHKSLQS